MDESDANLHWHYCKICQQIRYCVEERCQPNPLIPREKMFRQICSGCIPKSAFFKMLSGNSRRDCAAVQRDYQKRLDEITELRLREQILYSTEHFDLEGKWKDKSVK